MPENSFQHLPFDPGSSRDAAARLRTAADGEASDSVTGEDAARVSFERDLRDAVGRVMGADAAPAGLRDDLVRAMRDEASSDGGLRLVGTPARPARPSLRPSWWLAAAAGIALVVSVVLFRPVTGPSPVSPGRPQASPGEASRHFVRLVAFVSEQHDACAAFGEFFDAKITSRSREEARAAASELLGRIPRHLDLRSESIVKAGYRFAGLGPCAVPGKGPSVHMLFRADPVVAPGAPIVSVFVQEDTGDLPIDPGPAYAAPASIATPGGTLTVWRDGGLVYYLVAPPIPLEARRAFNIPDEERPLL